MQNLYNLCFYKGLQMKTLLMAFFSNTHSNLMLTKMDFVWTDIKKEIVVQIDNSGECNTGPLAIKFDVEKAFGISQSHVCRIDDIKRGGSINVTVDFNVFEQMNDNYLRDVERLKIYVEGVSENEDMAISGNSKKFNSSNH